MPSHGIGATVIARHLGLGFLLDMAAELVQCDDGDGLIVSMVGGERVHIVRRGLDRFACSGRELHAFQLRDAVLAEIAQRERRIHLEVKWIFESLSQPHAWDMIYSWSLANRDHPSDRADREYRAQRRRSAEGRMCECGCGQPITEMSRLRRYLKGHNCQSKERNARKAAALGKKCALDGCANKIPATLKATIRRFCSERCRRKAEARRAWKREVEVRQQ